MSPYDDERYQTKQIFQLRKATFAGAWLGTTADKTATAAAVSDRLQFFQAIKVVGMKAIPEVAPDAGAHLTSQTFKLALTDGTTVFARTTIGTVAGVMATGSVISANIAAGKILDVRMALSGQDGTVQTFAPGACWAEIEYQNRF